MTPIEDTVVVLLLIERDEIVINTICEVHDSWWLKCDANRVKSVREI